LTGGGVSGLIAVATVATLVLVFRNQDLLNERFKLPVQKGNLWQTRFSSSCWFFYCGVILLIPFDVFRFHWFAKPGAIVSALGLLLFLAG